VGAHSVYLEIVLILTPERCKVCEESTIGLKILLDHPMELLGDVGHLESISVHLETLLARCKIGARFAPNVP
jgi:hypothetical protein